jgi:phosphate-selective porin OprO/OprP
LFALLLPSSVAAQSPESEAAPERGEFTPGALPPAEAFAIPDVPPSVTEATQVKSKWFTLKPGLVAILDYTAFGQDENSKAQVGGQESQLAVRAARLMFRGTVGSGYKVSYLLAGEYKGFETAPENLWALTDVSLTLPLGGESVKLTLGKTKETFGYEMAGDAANLPHQERVLSPFFVSRSVGVKVFAVLGAQHRMTLSGGLFDDTWFGGDELSTSGTDATVRFTGLVRDAKEGTSFVHVAVAGRYAGADDDVLRFRARPASNVSDYYVDTDKLPGDHSLNLGLEALWNEGPFSVLAEYTQAWLDAPAVGDPSFNGLYVTGSWVLTGETRKYDRTVGYARRVMPTKRWGAPELVVRYAHEDLNSGLVLGGSMDIASVGLNWWATRRWKAGVHYQHVWLDRDGVTGNTDMVHGRLQYVY